MSDERSAAYDPRAVRTNHRAMCVDDEGTIVCVCSLGNPGDDR